MEVTIYYKNVTIGGEKRRVYTRDRMTNEEFTERVNHTRRLFGHAMYPRWLCTRMLLGETLVILRRNNLYKHNVKKAANILIKEFDAFERLHTMDFDQDWIEVMSGSMATQLQPRINALRGAMGGEMLKRGVKNYILYSYPMTVLVLAKEGAQFHDAFMRKINSKYGIDLEDVFQPLRGTNIIGRTHSLMSAVEDAVGERLQRGLDLCDTLVDIQLQSLAREYYDDNTIARAFKEADDECRARDFDDDTIAEQLSTKFKVTRI